MSYLKPQYPLSNANGSFYPLTTADQVLLSDGTRLEKGGRVVADSSKDSEKLGGYAFDALKSYVLDLAHPVGSYYWSANATNPASLFGGTWEQVKDKFVLAAGSTYTVGSTGGIASTRHVSYLPPINSNNAQTAPMDYVDAFITKASTYLNENGQLVGGAIRNSEVHNIGGQIDQTRSIATEVSQFNYEVTNMPPYVVAYCWKRTA